MKKTHRDRNQKSPRNLVAKHARTFNKAAVHKDRKREEKLRGPKGRGYEYESRQ